MSPPGDTKTGTRVGSYYKALLPVARLSAQRGLWRALEIRRERLAAQGRLEVEIGPHRTGGTRVVNRFCGIEVPDRYRIVHRRPDGASESFLVPNDDGADADPANHREAGASLPDPVISPAADEAERVRREAVAERERQYEGWFGPFQKVAFRHPSQSNAGIPLDIDVFAPMKGTRIFTVVTSGLTDPQPVAGLPEGAAGRGYEFLIQATVLSPWCFGLIVFLVQREMQEPGSFLRLLKAKRFLTMPAMATPDLKTNRPLLVGAPIPRLPETWNLPNGAARFVALTALHPEEFSFSKKLGADELVALLYGAGIGHMTDLERPPAAKA